jgi:imidazolonepropionase-like amidohydrolase
MSIRNLFVCAVLVVTMGCSTNGNTESTAALTVAAVTVPDTDEPKTLFTNVQVFDGVTDGRSAVDVLVQGNLIKQVGAGIDAPGATVIDGGGRTLMPGLIEMHTHIMFQFGVPDSRTFDHAAMGAAAYEGMRTYMDMGSRCAIVERIHEQPLDGVSG